MKLAPDEIFVSDGGKSDSANLQEIFAGDCVVALMDPVYPVYADSNVVAGRSGKADDSGRYAGMVYLSCTAENNFQPALPERRADLALSLLSQQPDRRGGRAAGACPLGGLGQGERRRHPVRRRLRGVHPRRRRPAHDLRDRGRARGRDRVPQLLKSAGFTGLRLAYTVVPKEMRGRSAGRHGPEPQPALGATHRDQVQRAAYIVQKAAAATYSPDGQKQVRALVDSYMENARTIAAGLTEAGFTVYGGRNAPYIWIRIPAGISSWDFFDQMLAEAHVVGAPGGGFGPSGEGYFRLTAFGSREKTEEAVSRIRAAAGERADGDAAPRRQRDPHRHGRHAGQLQRRSGSRRAPGRRALRR